MNCAQHPEAPAAAYCRTCGKSLCTNCIRDVRGVIYCEDCIATRLQSGPAASAAVRTPPSTPHPAVSGILSGFFPFGVGQAYNGQYARGLVYLVIFIGLVWVLSGGQMGGAEPVFGLLLAAFYFWQLIDAVRSAHYIQLGLPAPDPFGIDRVFGQGAVPPSAPVPPPAPVQGQTSAPPPPIAEDSALTNSAGWTPSFPQGTRPFPGYPPPHGSADSQQRHRSQVPLGASILIIIGTLLLMGNIGFLHLHWVGRFWPMILIVIGGWLLAQRWGLINTGSPHGRRALMGPAVLLTLGMTFLLSSFGGVHFGRSWPLLLIVIGLVLLWQRSAPSATLPSSSSTAAPTEPPQPDDEAEPGQER